MDIRTRLSLALVFVSLLSMMLLGTFAYYTSSNLLQEISLRQLDALAESKRRDLNKVYDGWEDNLRLVREIKQLRYAIRDYVENDDPQGLRTIQNTIQGITVAVKEIDKLIIFDTNGEEITSFGRSKVNHSNLQVKMNLQKMLWNFAGQMKMVKLDLLQLKILKNFLMLL